MIISRCCKSQVNVESDKHSLTYHYACDVCGRACDTVFSLNYGMEGEDAELFAT